MSDTPNHEYNVPDQGDQDWHQPLNENFEDFEVDIELRDQEANLGNYQPTQGAKFLATDTGVVYTGDGNTWVAQFVLPGYDDAADEAQFGRTVVAPELDVGTLAGSLTGGTALTTIAGNNLSIDSNGQLNASGGGGGGGGGISNLSGGDGISPGSIGDGDTLSVAWGDADDLDSDGTVTGGTWTVNSDLLEPSDSSIGGIDVDRVETTTLTVDGTTALQLGPTDSDGNNTAGGNVIGGYENNGVQNGAVGATVSGGGSDGTTDFGGNIGERSNTNEVTGDYGTVGGGQNNRAGLHAVIGGGIENTATGENATISGGNGNTANSPDATVGGGTSNTARGGGATVAGGLLNNASGQEAAIGGGTGHLASGDQATISGGTGNFAAETFTAVGGGAGNDADGRFATIPGGDNNTASGKFSFAAGKRAKATNEGAFVWADSTDEDVSSTGADQFLVEANGGTGIGTTEPETTFHVRDSVAESGGDNIGRHVAAIQNTNSSSSSPIPDVLGLELTNVTDPGQFHSYISFMDSTGTIGNIQGDGSGGVEFTGSTADFAEYFPKADPDREFTGGTVVGLRDGEVVDLAEEDDPDATLVVSTAPLVTGNRPVDEAERDGYVKLSLVGQVPVRVSEAVDHGDVLVASPAGDGTAVARADCAESGRPVVGMALAAGEAGEEVRTLIGGPVATPRETTQAVGGGATDREAETEGQTARLDALEAENERLRAENEELRERLAAVEERLDALEGGTTSPATADD